MEQLVAIVLAGCTITAAFGKQPDGRMEAKLLAAMQEATQCVVEDHIYTDMDHDGKKEMVGAYRDEKGGWEAGFCSSDGQICAPVPLNNVWRHDCCTLRAMDLGEETHIVFNCWNLMGTEKRYAILVLRDQEIVCLVPFQYGYVRMTDTGDILLNVEDYDSMFDPFEPEDDSDGIMHIQCDVKNEFGGISYGYYTVRYEGNVLEKEPGVYNPGRMFSSFSNFEKVY